MHDPLRIPSPHELGAPGAPVPPPFDRATMRCPMCGAADFVWRRQRQFRDARWSEVWSDLDEVLDFDLATCRGCRFVAWFRA